MDNDKETGEEANEANKKTNKEALDELASKVSKQGIEIVIEWAQKIGTPILIGYGAFIGGMFFMPFIDMMFIRPSLYEVFKLANCAIFAWIALVSIVLPQLWKNPKSYYAYAAPVAALVLALLKASISARGVFAELTSPFGMKPSEDAPLIFNAIKSIDFGIGFWVVTSSATWLAYKGITKGRKLRSPISTS